MKTSGSSLNLKQITKSYDEGTQRRVVLNDLDLDLRSPSFVAILGSSGCGKTTLLSILGGLDSDYHGSFDIAGFDAATLSSEQWDAYRGRHVGFVFQNPQLVDYLTVAENVKLAKGLSGTASSDASDGEPIAQSLSLVGMDDYAEAMPNELSGVKHNARPSPAQWQKTRASSLPTSRPDRSTRRTADRLCSYLPTCRRPVWWLW